MKPKVYFKSLRDSNDRQGCLIGVLNSLQSELEHFKRGRIIGIKITIGDSKATSYIRPELVKLVVNKLKSLQLRPFVFDTNVIYQGERMNAVDHLNLAYAKGFSPEALGCPFIIADGVFGTDSRAIKIDSVRKNSPKRIRFSKRINLRNLKEIRVPSLIMVLENLIVLTHITGHLFTGYAASIKNVLTKILVW